MAIEQLLEESCVLNMCKPGSLTSKRFQRLTHGVSMVVVVDVTTADGVCGSLLGQPNKNIRARESLDIGWELMHDG